MITFQQIKSWPDATVVDAVQGKIVAVYDYSQHAEGRYGPYTVQNAEIQDVAGLKLRIGVWDHPDLSPMKGQDVVLYSTNKKGKLQGVTVAHESFQKDGQTVNRIGLKVTRAGCFQHVEVWKKTGPAQANPEAATAPQASGGSPDTQQPPNAPQVAGNRPAAVNGSKVGMALNNVAEALINDGVKLSDPDYYKKLTYHCSRFIEVSDWLERGNVIPKE